MKILNKLLIVSCVFAGLVGCDRAPENASADAQATAGARQTANANAQKGVFSIPQAARDQVLVTVNGEAVSVGDFRDRQQLECAFFRVSRGEKDKLATAPTPARVKELEKFKKGRQNRLIAELVNQKLVHQYLQKVGASLAADQVTTISSNLLRKTGYRKNLATFVQESGCPEPFVMSQMLVGEEMQAAARQFDADSRAVTEKEIDDGLVRMEDYRKRACASNAVTFATCSNLVDRIKKGESFEELGKHYGFAAEEAVEWDTLMHEECTNKDFEKWAFSAPIGSVGGPYELADFIGIFKILERTEGMEKPSAAAKEVANVRLARIGFVVIDPEPEPRTREYVRGALLNWKQKRAQKKLMEKLHKEMQLVYPNGTNFTYEVTTSAQP